MARGDLPTDILSLARLQCSSRSCRSVAGLHSGAVHLFKSLSPRTVKRKSDYMDAVGATVSPPNPIGGPDETTRTVRTVSRAT